MIKANRESGDSTLLLCILNIEECSKSMVERFEDLIVWQEARNLNKNLFTLVHDSKMFSFVIIYLKPLFQLLQTSQRASNENQIKSSSGSCTLLEAPAENLDLNYT